jgi:hypothetical protein
MATKTVGRQNGLHILVEIKMLSAVCGYRRLLPAMTAHRRAEQSRGRKQSERKRGLIALTRNYPL